MRKIREILRLRFECNMAYRKIAKSVNAGDTTVYDCLLRFKGSGLSWPLSEDMDDFALEQRLYQADKSEQKRERPLPSWSEVHTELRKKGVTKQLLWIEYKEAHPDGYEYTQFCHLYREWKKVVDVAFRNEYRAGEKCFVDYAGPKVPIHDATTGEVTKANIFIAVLGASNYVFSEATMTQGENDWLESHGRAFLHFGGVPEIVVSDNLKSGVEKPCRYDPVLNPSYFEMSKHYGCAIIPARVRKPKDKAKVETSVLLVERWILAALRHRKFFSLTELNAAIAELLTKLNRKPFKKLEGCRLTAFETIDKPALARLPSKPFEVAEMKVARVNINYHVEFDKRYYSVPYQLVRQEVIVRATASTVEILHGNKRVASHQRCYKKGEYATIKDHMPLKHQAHVKWTPERMARWAGEAGPATKAVAESIMASKLHPQQGFNAVLGLIRLGERFGKDRLEKAAHRALSLNSPNFRSIRSILQSGMDRMAMEPHEPEAKPVDHENVRGPGYYN